MDNIFYILSSVVALCVGSDNARSDGALPHCAPGELAAEFSVDDLGVVRLLNGDLDRERRPQVLLTVAAFDMGPDQGRRSASALVSDDALVVLPAVMSLTVPPSGAPSPSPQCALLVMP